MDLVKEFEKKFTCNVVIILYSKLLLFQYLFKN